MSEPLLSCCQHVHHRPQTMKTPQGHSANCQHKQPKHFEGVLHNQIEVVTYTAVNNKCEMHEIALFFQRRAGVNVFRDTFFPWGGGGVKAAAGGGRDGWVPRGGGVSSEEF